MYDRWWNCFLRDRRARSAAVGSRACAIARARVWYACAWAVCRYACKRRGRAGKRTFPGNARNSDCARSTRPYRTTSTASSRRCYSVSQIFAISANFSALQQQKHHRVSASLPKSASSLASSLYFWLPLFFYLSIYLSVCFYLPLSLSIFFLILLFLVWIRIFFLLSFLFCTNDSSQRARVCV